jgi:hypothetical protein
MVTRRRLALAGSIGVAFAVLVIAPACGSGFLEGLSGGRKDAAEDTGPPVDAGVEARACTPHVPPPPPGDVQDTELPGTVAIAIDAFRIDDSTTVDASIPPSVGFDIDRSCTCPEPESCVAPDAGLKKCDGDGGSDNALGRLFSTLGSFYPNAFGPDFATDAIRKGSYGAVMSIGGWNRQSNDPKVFVAVYLSQGTDGKADGGDGSLKLDGSDVWTIDPASVKNGDAHVGVDCNTDLTNCLPEYSTANAYIADDTLVARIAVPFALSASSGRIVIQMEDVAVAVKIRKDGSLFRAEGEFTGRWPVTRVLRALAETPVNDVPLCDQPVLFNVAKGEICAAVDVTSDPATDHAGKQCDSVSAAFRFTGTSAVLGRVYKQELPAAACQGFMPTCN